MIDQYGNVVRSDGTQPWVEANGERNVDAPISLTPGWAVNGNEYTEMVHPTVANPTNDVVTRAANYAPYQSMLPVDRYGYDPTNRQYPQMRDDELASGRRAETPADRVNAWDQLRPPHAMHPRETIDLGVRGYGDPVNRPGPQYPLPPPPPHLMNPSQPIPQHIPQPIPIPQRVPQPAPQRAQQPMPPPIRSPYRLIDRTAEPAPEPLPPDMPRARVPRPATNPGQPIQRPTMPPPGARPGGNQFQRGQGPMMPPPGARRGGNQAQQGQRPTMPPPGARSGGNQGQQGYGGARPGPGNAPAGSRGGSYGQRGGSRGGRGGSNAPARGNRGRGGGRREFVPLCGLGVTGMVWLASIEHLLIERS
jgi:hypothetical protein